MERTWNNYTLTPAVMMYRTTVIFSINRDQINIDCGGTYSENPVLCLFSSITGYNSFVY